MQKYLLHVLAVVELNTHPPAFIWPVINYLLPAANAHKPDKKK